MNSTRYNFLLHRTAQLTAAATLLLIFMGGLVTSHGAGLSVPDWPNSYGYNMFTFPPSKWIGGIFYEHTHRLMGTLVGLCSTLLVMIAWGFGRNAPVRRRLLIWGLACTTMALMLEISSLTRIFVALPAYLAFILIGSIFCRHLEPRRWVRWLATSVLFAVIFQGILGGLRVVLVKLDLAIIHACVAQAFFCLTALLAVVTSRWWLDASSHENERRNRRLIALAVACAIAIYLQLILGATMRHLGAGLAIPDLPLSYGRLIPPLNQSQLDAARVGNYENFWTWNATLQQVWLNFAHRVGAVVVTILLTVTIVSTLRGQRNPGLRRPALSLILLLITQITLGAMTVLLHKPADVASLHVAVGALTLMTTFVLLVRTMRLHSPLWRNAPQRGFEVDIRPNPAMVPA